MKFQLKKAVIKNLEGEALKNGEKEFTVAQACVNALLADYQEDKINGEEKLKRFVFAKKINQDETIELKSEDVTLIKSLIAKAYNALIVGSVYEVLENPIK